MDMQGAIGAVTEGRDLGAEDMARAMRLIMTGEASPAQIGAFLAGLRAKGETVDEIAAAAGVMRELATRVHVADDTHLVDTCGTGGDASGIFNVSTAVAFVAAAGGARVAKHGNRSVSSRSGSADVLEAAGVPVDLGPEDVARCIETVGVGFLFAPQHHGAMRHAVGPRRELGVRTLFNVLGPLTNPAGAPNQLIGVYDVAWVRPLAEVLGKLGSRHVLVVHADDGLDELSIAAPATVAELRDGVVESYRLDPADLGVARGSLEELRVADGAASLATIRRALAGEPGPALEMIALNAGAALYVAGCAETIAAGVSRARELLTSGAGERTLQHLVDYASSLGRT